MKMAKMFCPKCGAVIYEDEIGCIYDDYVRTDAEMQPEYPCAQLYHPNTGDCCDHGSACDCHRWRPALHDAHYHVWRSRIMLEWMTEEPYDVDWEVITRE
jgi:hypothetical protein